MDKMDIRVIFLLLETDIYKLENLQNESRQLLKERKKLFATNNINIIKGAVFRKLLLINCLIVGKDIVISPSIKGQISLDLFIELLEKIIELKQNKISKEKIKILEIENLESNKNIDDLKQTNQNLQKEITSLKDELHKAKEIRDENFQNILEKYLKDYKNQIETLKKENEELKERLGIYGG